MTVRNFRDLRVWQMGMDLVESVYGLTESFPGHERYGLASQLQRAVVSVPSNIAEGQARHHLKEYLNHLSIAQASLAEVDTQLEIAVRLKYIPRDKSADIRDHLDSLGKQIRALRRSLSMPLLPNT
jgi:four helix bundle protein